MIPRRALLATLLALAVVPAAAATPAWLPPESLSAPGQDAASPHVAVDSRGDTAALWTRSNGTHVIVQASVRLAEAGAWGPAQDLSPSGRDASSPEVAIDAAGDAFAVWYLQGVPPPL